MKTLTVRGLSAAATGTLRAAFRAAPGHPVRPASTLRLLTTEESLFQALHALVARARRELAVRMYMVVPDATGDAFADALLAARARSVEVRLVVDEIGSKGAGALLERLRAGGVEVRVFNSLVLADLSDLDNRDHAKVVICDRELAWLASANIGDAYRGWFHDVGVTLGGDVVADLQESFGAVWAGLAARVSPVPRSPLPRPLQAVGRGGLPLRLVENGYDGFALLGHVREMLKAARTRIDVHHCYLTHAEVIRLLVERAREGVKVTVVLPERSDVPAVGLVMASDIDELVAAGVRVYRIAGMSHRKVLLVDRRWLLLGSGNLDALSAEANLEVNVAVYSRTVGLLVTTLVFARDLHAAEALTASPLPWWLRPLAWLLTWIRPWL